MSEPRERPTEHALRATSDTLLSDLEQLLAWEQEKRMLEPNDPRRPVLASRIAEVAQRVMTGATEQAMLTADAATAVKAGSPEAPIRTIDETSPRSLHDILSAWRDAERRAVAAEPGSAEAAVAAEEVSRLRFEYRRAYQRAADESQDD